GPTHSARFLARVASPWAGRSTRTVAGSTRVSAPVIDAHHHFWDPARFAYPWMEGAEMAPLRRPFGPADLAPLIASSGVDATIVVQCCSSVAETEAFLAIAEETPFVAGVIGWLDLTDAAVDATLDGMVSRAKLVG